jgi:hypothetical protein
MTKKSRHRYSDEFKADAVSPAKEAARKRSCHHSGTVCADFHNGPSYHTVAHQEVGYIGIILSQSCEKALTSPGRTIYF